MSSDWRQRSAQSDASTISPSTRLSPRLPSPVFQSSFTQASDQPIELFSTAQKSMYILTSDHASLHAKLMAKCTAHEEGFPPHPLTSSTCPKWVCSMAAIQFWFVPLCQANPSICQVQIFFLLQLSWSGTPHMRERELREQVGATGVCDVESKPPFHAAHLCPLSLT